MAAPTPLLLLLYLAAASLLPAATAATIFNFTSFTPNTRGINYSGDAFAGSHGAIQLTEDHSSASSGHAVYAAPVQLWDPTTGSAADFATHFKFKIQAAIGTNCGDGFAVFFAPVGYPLVPQSGGGLLGLFNGSASEPIIAVEFDTYQNKWDPDANHIGIDIGSIISTKTATWATNFTDMDVGAATVGYNSTRGYLYVSLTSSNYNTTQNLFFNLNLSSALPDTAIIGFSASTGNAAELHKIISWDFQSSSGDWVDNESTSTSLDPKSNNLNQHFTPHSHRTREEEESKTRSWAAVVAVVVVLMVGTAAYRSIVTRINKRTSPLMNPFKIESTLPRAYSYRELTAATRNFRIDRKLGQGGSGGVYKGVLYGEDVAVKRITRPSVQGRKEYLSELTVISRLRHRNLVRLIGWCHESGELILVYEQMPNGSLDTYLFGGRGNLTWEVRYRIACGVAAALLYLHEEWDRCVLHRDVKASNVMLDAWFNPRLGDFGLAKMMDHGVGPQTTVLAGTMGYLAPECVVTGRAGPGSDVYSFGVVALEIACGKMAVGSDGVRLVDWAWGMYGAGRVAEAADVRLGGEFDEGEMERLVVVGLWCAHPDCKVRPTIREAIQVLALGGTLPKLPRAPPRPVYYPPLSIFLLDTAKGLGLEGSTGFSGAEGSTGSGEAALYSGESLLR